jgi:beta-lactamase regulating signal transducer with metallopeptidase domain
MRLVIKGRVSPRLQYALWALVLVRLLLPFSLAGSPISIMNIVGEKSVLQINDSVSDNSAYKGTEEQTEADAAAQDTVTDDNAAAAQETSAGEQAEKEKTDLQDIVAYVRYAGMAAIAVVILISNIGFALRLRKVRKRCRVSNCPLPVYVVRALQTPCMFGLFRPAIYITPEVFEDKNKLRHVLAHETAHFRHGDHVWAALRGVCLAVYWFDPLVWLAADLSRRDAELACDESAIASIGEDSRIEYGRTLIGLTCEKRRATDLMCCATTMTGGKKSIMERIKLIANKPKTAAYTLVAVILIAALAAGCTFTGAEKELGIIADGIDVPDTVLEAAKTYVGDAYADSSVVTDGDGNVVPTDYEYTNWQITSLEKVYTYDDIGGLKLDVYQMNYEFKADKPENVPLAGGMYVTDDGWVCPTYPDCTYLLTDSDTDEYIAVMMENDCEPGDDTFTADLEQLLGSTPAETDNTEVDLSQYAVTGLDKNESSGIGVFLDYADDDIIVFHGYFGLFVYDLKNEEIKLSVDLQKSVGSTDIQGSCGAGVSVSTDGSTIQLYYYPEAEQPENAYYINTMDMSCVYGPYDQLTDTFNTTGVSVSFTDGTTGTITDEDYTIGSLKYVRGDKTYEIFKNF